jgi:hypothetical protein
MSDPISCLIEFEYEFESGSVKKSLKYMGNENVVIRQETNGEEVSIRIPRKALDFFMQIIEAEM